MLRLLLQELRKPYGLLIPWVGLAVLLLLILWAVRSIGVEAAEQTRARLEAEWLQARKEYQHHQEGRHAKKDLAQVWAALPDERDFAPLALGITEETDAVVVVVSEERGSISLCFGGNIARDLDSPTLRKALLGLFQKQKRRAQTQKSKEREVPAALEALPFEKPQPPEEPDAAPTLREVEGNGGEAEETKRDAAAAEVEAKPAESS